MAGTTTAIDVYVSAPWRMDGIDAQVDAVIAAAAAQGTTLNIVKPWWRTGGAAGLDADGKPATTSKSEATPKQKQATLGKDCADLIKLFKGRKGPRVMLVLGDGALKSTIFLQGLAVGANKSVVVMSTAYAAWFGADGAGSADAEQPAWVGNLAMTPAAATFVSTPEDAAAAVVKAGTPKPSKKKTAAATAAAAPAPSIADDDDEEEDAAPPPPAHADEDEDDEDGDAPHDDEEVGEEDEDDGEEEEKPRKSKKRERSSSKKDKKAAKKAVKKAKKASKHDD